MPIEDFEFRNIKGHIEVYLENQFLFSCDTKQEAIDELSRMIVLK